MIATRLAAHPDGSAIRAGIELDEERRSSFDTRRKVAMLVVHVHVHVKPEHVESFRALTRENATESVRETGIARFDVFQEADDPTRFVLVEVYRDAQAPARHKETAHYLKWRDGVADMMAEARRGVRYQGVFPDEDGWESVKK